MSAHVRTNQHDSSESPPVNQFPFFYCDAHCLEVLLNKTPHNSSFLALILHEGTPYHYMAAILWFIFRQDDGAHSRELIQN
jgi:hypothetical protein